MTEEQILRTALWQSGALTELERKQALLALEALITRCRYAEMRLADERRFERAVSAAREERVARLAREIDRG